MAVTRETISLSHEGVMKALAAGIAYAEGMKVPQNIVIVDASGEVLGQIRMDGAKFLSTHTARAKAKTAASSNAATGTMAFEFGVAAGLASQGQVTHLMGGLPIRFGGKLAGAIGVGSGKGEEDVEVGRAALAAIGADAV